MAKGKKDINKLIPVKKMITRNGKTFETTVYVREKDLHTVMQKPDMKPIDMKIKLRQWGRIDSVENLKFHMDSISNIAMADLKEIARNEFVEFMKRSGVKWEEHEDKALNWMRCTMAVKRAIKNNTFVPEGSDRKAEIKPYKTMTKEEARKVLKEWTNGMPRKNLHQIIKENGVTWNECEHEGINHMRAMMALREHIEDGNEFLPLKNYREENPEFHTQNTGEGGLDEILASAGQERIMSDEMKKAKTHEEMYKACTPLGRKLAVLTGMIPKDKEAEQYMLDNIKNGNWDFGQIINPSNDMPDMPDFIKDGIKFSHFNHALTENLNDRWDSVFRVSEFYYGGLNVRELTECFDKDDKNPDNKILKEELDKHVKNFKEMDKKYCRTIAQADIHLKASMYNIASKLERYNMAGMIKLKRTTTRREFMKDFANNILDLDGLDDNTVETIFQSLGGVNAFTDERTFNSTGYKESLLGALMSLCVTAHFDTRNFTNEFITVAGIKPADYSWNRREQMNNFVSQNPPRKVLETLSKVLNNFVDGKAQYGHIDPNWDRQLQLDTCPIEDAFTDYAPTGRQYNIFRIMMEQGRHTNTSTRMEAGNISDLKEILGEAMNFHNDKFENERAKYFQANTVLISQVPKDFTQKRQETYFKRFEPIPFEDFQKMKDNPRKVLAYAKGHIANFYQVKGKKKKQEARQALQDKYAKDMKYDRISMALHARQGNYDKIPEVSWEDIQNVGDGTKLHWALETVPKTSQEAKNIWTKFQKDDNDNEQHKKFGVHCHRMFQITVDDDYNNDYNKMKEEKGNEVDLYHGTSAYATQLIGGETGRCKKSENVDPSLKTGSMLGRGTYLAKQTKKASQYMGKQFGTRWGTRGTIFMAKAVLGNVVETKIRGEYLNQKIMNQDTTDTVAMYKTSGSVLNDEWAVKTPEQFMPKYLLDCELVHPDHKDPFTTNNQGREWEYNKRHGIK